MSKPLSNGEIVGGDGGTRMIVKFQFDLIQMFIYSS